MIQQEGTWSFWTRFQLIKNFRILFQNKDYRRFYFGDSLKLLATSLSRYGCLWYVWDKTHSGFKIGCLVAAELGPTLLLSFVGGLIADGRNRFGLVRRYQAMIAGLTLCIAFATWAGPDDPDPSVLAVIILYALVGVCTALLTPCSFTITTSIVDHAVLSKAVSVNSLNANAASVLGPGLAYIISAAIGFWPIFLISSAFMLYYVYNMGHIKKRSGYIDPFTDERISEVPGQLFKLFRRVPNFAPLYGFLLWIAVSARPVVEQYPALIKDVTGDGQLTTVGIFGIIIGLGNFSGSLLQSSRHKSIAISDLVYHILFSAIAILAICNIKNPIITGISMFALCANLAISRIIILYLLQISVEEVYRGRMLSMYFGVIVGVSGVATLLVGTMGHAQLKYYDISTSAMIILSIWILCRRRRFGFGVVDHE